MGTDKAGHLVGGVHISYTFILSFSLFTSICHRAGTTEILMANFKIVVKFEGICSIQLFMNSLS